ncbi:sodium-dependent phosphate transport protein 3-like [Ornithorhynchus anatinus]|uniref:sodium-dependent phosphate transport protein 3-like n=1 Tax=Ornithorhynchus anatinus TaxID=9258 RepID=UPI0019D4D2BF|nr:sodium-dependent phosphate transport protein 3-like [Ornithorhynchus anatinus]
MPGPAGPVPAVPFVGRGSVPAAVVPFSLSMTVISLNGAGFLIDVVDVAPGYAGLLQGITSTFGTISGMVAPAVVGFLTSQDALAGWRNVCFLTAAINLFGLVFFVPFGEADARAWAREGGEDGVEDGGEGRAPSRSPVPR